MVVHPKKIDGSIISVLQLPGSTYVDPQPLMIGFSRVNRGGPHADRHHCRFEEYGLVDHIRCTKCGLVRLRDGV